MLALLFRERLSKGDGGSPVGFGAWVDPLGLAEMFLVWLELSMAHIELSASIRRSVEEIAAFLTDFRNHPEFLPKERFRRFEFGDGSKADSFSAEIHLLGRWFPVTWTNAGSPESGCIVQEGRGRFAVKTTWRMDPLRPDRRGPRTAVRLDVEYKPPGGPLGRLLDIAVLRSEMLKLYDQIMRRLPIVLEGPPKSGLKLEEP